MASPEDIKLLKSKQQLLKDIKRMEDDGLKTAFDRKEIEKEIAALQKKIANENKEQAKQAAQAGRNAAKYKSIQDQVAKAEKEQSKTIGSRLLDIAKGNVLSALSLKSTMAQKVAQTRLAKSTADMADFTREAKEYLGVEDYGKVLDLTKGIADGTIRRSDLEEQIQGLNEKGQEFIANSRDAVDGLVQLKKEELEASEAQEIRENQIAKIRIASAAALAVGFTAVSKILSFLIKSITQFSEKVGKIGAQFGSLANVTSEVNDNIIKAQQNVVLVGASIDDVLSTTAKLATEFGLTDDVAAGISDNIIDSAAAIGLSNDEAAALNGLFMQIGGLTQDEVENITEGAKQLGDQNRITSQVQAGFRDLVGSADNFTKFIGGGVKELIAGATQARRLGLNLDEVANAGRSFLDIQQSIEKETAASVLLGRQINLNEARRLVMMKDTEGLIAELRKQAGGVDFVNLDILTQEAFAEALGMSVSAVAKLTSTTKELDIAGALAGESFDDLLGQDSLGAIQKLRGQFDQLIMKIQDGLGASIEQVANSIADFLANEEKVATLKAQISNLGNVLVGVASSISQFFESIPADSDPITFMFERIGNSISDVLRKAAALSTALGVFVTIASLGSLAGVGAVLAGTGVGLSLTADALETEVPGAAEGALVKVHDGEAILNPVQQSQVMGGSREVISTLNAIKERLDIGIPMKATVAGDQITIATDEGYVGGSPGYQNLVVK